ncbi:ABC transporter permease [Actinotalea sp. C106]|uniref:ABC transporter permease n=1 Tax=Actinotalea sp. C106 TaxID=2908644 RepID=UPI0020277C62|nr:ABC transporter permease [Actinotalea sp. C106]
MTALRALTLAEGRLYLRDAGTAFFALAFPTVLLVLMAFALPGMRDPIEDLPGFAGLRPIDLYAPVAVAMAIATTSLTTFPAVFGTYREKGVLRRLSTTPLPASRLLVAQVSINIAALVVAVAAALTAASFAFEVAAPSQPGVVLVAFLLGAAHMTALGCVLAAVVPTASSANGLGMLLYFPMLFLAGVWTPGPLMPAGLSEVAAYLPLGAAAQAMSEGWFGDGLPITPMLAMVGWTVLLIPVAARLFRWR